jgi:hypothetical protein
MESLPCTICKGVKTIHSDGFTSLEGKVYPPSDRPCISCESRGDFPPLDDAASLAIIQRIVATKGKNKGHIRASMTAPWRDGTVAEARAYYVWRLARFHGGKDMTMPMSADSVVRGDPFKKELDALSDAVAKHCFGTDLAAARRWGQAFGIL